MTIPDVLHFQSIPWCAKLLADPRFTAAPTGSRSPKRSTEDSFFAETLQTDKTVRACLSLYCIPSPPSCDSAPSPRIQEVRTLISLGSGVNGYPRIAHGGFVATLLDEGMGILMEANKDKGSGRDNGNAIVTAFLNVKYRRPVPTPGIVLVTAKYTKVMPRKQFMRASVEDGEGTVYAEAEALFVEIREKL
ncbi:hypothetical protein MMC08_007766 [Hypocenomyce scalaris]|nr:hypothetical protein [Hypocenomyce scalaris]